MTNPTGVLARLFGRSKPAPIVSSLALAALDRPLLAHPAMAEALVAGYLTGTITSADTMLEAERVPAAPPAPEAESAGAIGVISITGALVNRPMPGPSGGGPISYVALRDTFDELLEDEGVTAIVLRIESPGGMASGCFDLTDHIFASRGRKPIHALVDDYAFSAAYAIAAACDEIWVSRTGGVGSVGACTFHADRSGNNEKSGIKVTPIFAGARKIDFNPNFPLSAEAQARAQTRINTLNTMFVGTVARYRGLSEGVVLATEADIFQGEEAVASGLATRQGTWDDLVAFLGAPGVDAPEQAGDGTDAGDEMQAPASAAGTAAEQLAIDLEGQPSDSEPPAPDLADAAPALDEAASDATPTAVEAADPEKAAAGTKAQLVELVAGSNLAADLAMAILRSEGAEQDPTARIEHARKVADLCAAAGLREVAAGYVTRNVDIEQVRNELAAAVADAGPAVITALPASASAVRGPSTLHEDVYSRRRAAAATTGT